MARKSEQAIENGRAYSRRYSATKYAADPEPQRAANRRWRKKHAARIRDRRFIKAYGITPAERDQRLAAQGGCAICRAPEPTPRGWQIDHDHVTGSIRGVLCVPCNTLVGRLGDNLHQVEARCAEILEYLR